MDQLTAYQILGLQPGADLQAIRDAYAEMSKKYHPEEHPDEFQQIHDAYQTLSRAARRSGRRDRAAEQERQSGQQPETADPFTCPEPSGEEAEQENAGKADTEEAEQDPESNEQEPEQAGPAPSENNWEQWEREQLYEERERLRQEREKLKEERRRMEEDRTRQTGADRLDFDSAVRKAQQEEQDDLERTVSKALAESAVLMEPQYRYKLKLFKTFFKKEEYQKALITSSFMQGLARQLEKTDLKGMIYDYIIDHYRMKSADRQNMHQGAAALYDVLDRKRGVHRNRLGAKAYGIPAGVLLALRIIIRRGIRVSDAFGTLIGCLLAVIGLAWLGRKLYENHSGVFAQFIVALIFSAAQFFVVMFDLYAPLFGDVDTGVTAAVLLMLAGIVWMIVLAVAAVIMKIRSRAR